MAMRKIIRKGKAHHIAEEKFTSKERQLPSFPHELDAL
jgi:hypothetical protein